MHKIFFIIIIEIVFDIIFHLSNLTNV